MKFPVSMLSLSLLWSVPAWADISPPLGGCDCNTATGMPDVGAMMLLVLVLLIALRLR